MLGSMSAFASFVFTQTGSWDIPDNNASGRALTISVGQPLLPLQEVQVNLRLSGGFNGDLYALLVHDNSFAVLLNRVGRVAGNDYGSPDGGFNVKLVGSSAFQDVHFAAATPPGAVLTGTYQADGREVSPDLDLSAYIADPNFAQKTTSLYDFAGQGKEASGDWQLYLADLSPGGISTLDSWSIELTTVPEPSIAGMAFGLVSLASFGGYKLRQRLAAKKA